MKTAITFTANPAHSNSAFLLHMANLLHQMRINPETLNWSAAEGAGIWLWMIVIREETHVMELITALESTDGVRSVRRQSVEQPVRRAPGLAEAPLRQPATG